MYDLPFENMDYDFKTIEKILKDEQKETAKGGKIIDEIGEKRSRKSKKKSF